MSSLTRKTGRRALVALLALVAIPALTGIAHAAPPSSPQTVQVLPPPLVPDLPTLLSNMRKGINPTDEQIKALRTGKVEPVLLALVAFRREIFAIENRYGEQITALDVAEIGKASGLATPASREQIRAKMSSASYLVRKYRSDNLAALRQAESAISTAYASIPGLGKDWPEEQARAPMKRRRAFLEVYVPLEMERQTLTLAIVQLLDDNARNVGLSDGPEPHLVFSDAPVLAQFRSLVDRLREVSARLLDVIPKPADEASSAPPMPERATSQPSP